MANSQLKKLDIFHQEYLSPFSKFCHTKLESTKKRPKLHLNHGVELREGYGTTPYDSPCKESTSSQDFVFLILKKKNAIFFLT